MAVEMGPVFIFGTGRSGSTHLQRLISLNTEVWVWGEHDGFLDHLLRGMIAYEDSVELKHVVFDQQLPEDDTQLVELMRREGKDLSWLNRLRPGDLRSELRELVERIFSRRVPEGWIGWGFKEIRYGTPNNVPAQLLDVFPECSAAFTFREPSATFPSMRRSWYPEQLETNRLNELPPFYYEKIVSWWLEKMQYFVELKNVRPGQIVMVEMQQMNRSPEAILELLGLPLRTRPLVLPNITNRGPAASSAIAEQAMAACFERWREETTAVLPGRAGAVRLELA